MAWDRVIRIVLGALRCEIFCDEDGGVFGSGKRNAGGVRQQNIVARDKIRSTAIVQPAIYHAHKPGLLVSSEGRRFTARKRQAPDPKLRTVGEYGRAAGGSQRRGVKHIPFSRFQWLLPVQRPS